MDLLTTITTMTAIAGFAKTVLETIKSGIDIVVKAKAERTAKKAGAQTAFKKLRMEIESNLAIVNDHPTAQIKGIPINDKGIKQFIKRLETTAIEEVFLCLDTYVQTPTKETKLFSEALFYTKQKIDSLKRLSTASAEELATGRKPNTAVRIKNLEAYLNAVRKML